MNRLADYIFLGFMVLMFTQLTLEAVSELYVGHDWIWITVTYFAVSYGVLWRLMRNDHWLMRVIAGYWGVFYIVYHLHLSITPLLQGRIELGLDTQQGLSQPVLLNPALVTVVSGAIWIWTMKNRDKINRRLANNKRGLS